tara:strand:- start:10346 stop:11788 length:1443 start_codon:yes stop_codon:yes gene_type:complete
MTSPSTSWKEATDTTAGDATKFGAPDGLNMNNQLFNGDLNVDNVDINSPWFYRSSKCYFLNNAGTYGFLIDSSVNIAADRTISFPLLLGNDTLVFQTFIQTISSKKIGNWLDFVEIAAPASPASSEHRNYFDSTTSKFTTKSSAGTVEQYTTNSGTQTLTNKTITSPTLSVLDNAFSIKDNADQTKIAVFQASGISSGVTRTYTLPNADTTLGGGDMILASAQIVSGIKTHSTSVIMQDTRKTMYGTGSDSSIVDTGSGMLIDIDEQNAGSKSLVIESDATALLTINDTLMTSSVPIDTPDVETSILSARDGTLAQTIANSTGVTTFVSGATLVAPVLGTPASGLLSNCTGLPLAGILPAAKTESIIVALGDEATALETGTKVTFYMPYAFTLTGVRSTVLTAPTGSQLIVDIHDAGTTIMTTHKLDIDINEFKSTDAAQAPVLTDTALADNTKIELIVDQIGSTVAGAGLKVYLIGYQS